MYVKNADSLTKKNHGQKNAKLGALNTIAVTYKLPSTLFMRCDDEISDSSIDICYICKCLC